MVKQFSNVNQIEEENERDPCPYDDTESDTTEDSGDENQGCCPGLGSQTCDGSCISPEPSDSED